MDNESFEFKYSYKPDSVEDSQPAKDITSKIDGGIDSDEATRAFYFFMLSCGYAQNCVIDSLESIAAEYRQGGTDEA